MTAYYLPVSWRNTIKKRNRKVVLVTGCFDVLHIGHARLLEFASLYGSVIVGINSDQSVKELKGASRPINNQCDRAELVHMFRCVYGAFVIHSTTVTDSILQIKPDFWVKGGQYTLDTLNRSEVDVAKHVGAEIVFAPHVEGCSSTVTIEKLKQ